MKGRVLCAIIASWVCFGSVMNADNKVMMQHEEEAELLRTLAKYSTVLRLIPIRISQMLQVVNAYPPTKYQKRAELLQLVIQRMHDKYRMVQQLSYRVTELSEEADPAVCAGVYGRSLQLLDALKKYQITLISTLSVLDSEFIRSLRHADEHKDDLAKSESDDAYKAAKAVLKQNQMDSLIEMLACGRAATDESPQTGSVKQEIRQLRDEVSQLSAQLKARALLENNAATSAKEFDAHMRELNVHHVQAVRDVQAVVHDMQVPEPVRETKKYSLRDMRVPAVVSDMAQILHARALAFHHAVWNGVSSFFGSFVHGTWYTNTQSFVKARWQQLSALLHRIFEDSGKAAQHVADKATEATQAVPTTFEVIACSVQTVGTWIIDSWARLGQWVWTYTQDAYGAVRKQVTGFDDYMRQKTCALVSYFSNIFAEKQPTNEKAKKKASSEKEPVSLCETVATQVQQYKEKSLAFVRVVIARVRGWYDASVAYVRGLFAEQKPVESKSKKQSKKEAAIQNPSVMDWLVASATSMWNTVTTKVYGLYETARSSFLVVISSEDALETAKKE